VSTSNGFDIYRADEASVFAPKLIASLNVPGYDTPMWTGYFCQNGSGTYGLATFAPQHFNNDASLSAGAAYLSVINLLTGTTTLLPATAALKYNSLGCGVGNLATATRYATAEDGQSQIYEVDLSTAKVVTTINEAGEITSAVPTSSLGVIGVQGNQIVSLSDEHSPPIPIATTSSAAFYLRPSADGGVDFLESSGLSQVGVWHMSPDRHLAEIGSGPSADVQLFAGRDGHNLLGGPNVHSIASSWPGKFVKIPGSIIAVSQEGDLTIDRATPAGPLVDGIPQGLKFAMTAIATETDATTAVLGTLSSVASGTKKSAQTNLRANAIAKANTPGSPTCAIPRLDYQTQVLQPSDQQVEWAADLAIFGDLTNTIPANYLNDNEPSFQPQGLISPVPLAGGSGHIPAQILLGILAQESNFDQASYHAVAGVGGDPLIADYYGTGGALSGINYANADCGYGLGQITTGMRAGNASPWNAEEQRLIALNFEANIAAAVQILGSTWNQLQTPGGVVTINGGNPSIFEDWYLALWAYNTGYHANAGNGSPWGVGWANNPANPTYPPNRDKFLDNPNDASTPGDWPYQERVIGWARHSQQDFVTGGIKYAPLSPNTVNIPSENTFCSLQVDSCSPGGSGQSGSCTLQSLECWWNGNLALVSDDPGEVVTYSTSAPEPSDPDTYPPACTSSSPLPSNATIINNVPNNSWNVVGCGAQANPGTFTFSGPADSMIDFHQLGVGYGGHTYFAHTTYATDTDHVVTGTWTPPSSVSGWNQVWVSVPSSGAATEQAQYTIYTSAASSETRIVNQRWNENTWVLLGDFDFASGGGKVSLTNATIQDYQNGGTGCYCTDVSYGAVAFAPTTSHSNYVALGDSYSSGWGMTPYIVDSNQSAFSIEPADTCARATNNSYPDLLAADIGVSDFNYLACQGDTTANVDPNAGNSTQITVNSGELPQIEQGYLDANTSLVTITIGGNDARFHDVLLGCYIDICAAPNFYLTVNGVVDPQPLIQYEPEVISGIATILNTEMADIRSAAPNAEIVVVGYPYLLPTSSAIALCSGVGGTGELAQSASFLNSMADQLDGELQTAASSAGAIFVDPRPSFEGHDVCSSTKYIAPLIAPSDGSFHPTTAGNAEYAQLVLNAIG
jgi:lysophospholipase L1-like esterase